MDNPDGYETAFRLLLETTSRWEELWLNVQEFRSRKAYESAFDTHFTKTWRWVTIGHCGCRLSWDERTGCNGLAQSITHGTTQHKYIISKVTGGQLTTLVRPCVQLSEPMTSIYEIQVVHRAWTLGG